MTWKPLRRTWRDALVPLLVWAIAAAAGGGAVLWSDAVTRQGLEQRAQMRTEMAAQFLAAQAQDVLTRERTLARQYLSGGEVSEAEFLQATHALGFNAAVLLDERGQLLQVAPTNHDRLGADMTGYPHLRQALTTGVPAVSPVVPSAARGVPLVGFAVPFETPAGRRVLSAGLEVQDSALGQYLRTAVALPGAEQYLVDPTGAIAATGSDTPLGAGTLAAVAPDVHGAVAGGSSVAALHGAPAHVASAEVRGTPWTLVVATPEDVLFAAADRSRTLSHSAFAALTVLGLGAAGLLARSRGHRRAARESDTRFRGIFDGSLVGMVICAPDGALLDVNDALCQMLDYTGAELLGDSWKQVTHPEDRAGSADHVRRVLSGVAPGCTFAKRYLRRDGSVLHAIVTTTLIRDEDGRPLYFATQVLDVTAQKQVEQAKEKAAAELAARSAELEIANTELSRANRAVSDLVAMLSHDLRQPLTAITGYADLALDEWGTAQDAEQRHWLSRISCAGHRINDMLEETLTLSALDAGALSTHPVPIRVDLAVTEVLASLEHTMPSVDLTGLCVTSALVDRGHLTQILTNVLTNAAKYGAAPYAVSCDEQHGTVLITVEDSGPGVAADFVPHLFDRFARSESARLGDQKGTGLGLYIVRSLVEANGGDLWYEPSPTGGSRFVLRLANVGITHSVRRPQPAPQ